MRSEELYKNLLDSFFIIAGPCVIESEELCFIVAEKVLSICRDLKIPYIFKSSFDKANRSSIDSFRGPGIEEGLKILDKVKERFKIPVTTDVHEVWQIDEVSQVVDIIQIPAFLSRQTDLLINAGKSGKIVNVKKGQFLSGYDMKNIINKIESTGNKKIILTERGNSFGYNNLVVDMRNFPIMKEFGKLVVFDATHSVQLPGGRGTCSGGNREFVFPLSKAAVATGINGIFFEVHPDPDNALCDGANSLSLDDVYDYIQVVYNIYRFLN